MYVIGEEGILKELELAGFQHLGGPVSNNFSEIHDKLTVVQKTSFTGMNINQYIYLLHPKL